MNYIAYDTPILSYDLPEYNIVFIPQNHEMYHMDETEQCLNGNKTRGPLLIQTHK